MLRSVTAQATQPAPTDAPEIAALLAQIGVDVEVFEAEQAARKAADADFKAKQDTRAAALKAKVAADPYYYDCGM